jgi:hypothetical protein
MTPAGRPIGQRNKPNHRAGRPRIDPSEPTRVVSFRLPQSVAEAITAHKLRPELTAAIIRLTRRRAKGGRQAD